ncbi:MAG: hypothetical protein CW341_00525 [Bacteroidetes bacterium]|nr:hypothetical protein [Bacteroidota bacterium]
MKKNTKILLVITGILLIALGVICIANPGGTLFAMTWLLGVLTLVSGISTLVFTFRTQKFMPNSGTRMLSGLFQIFIGIFFLCNLIPTTAALPFVFAFWVMMDGIILAVQSFDFKKFGFSLWWAILLLGIAGAVLGFLGLREPVISGTVLSTLIGIGIIVNGIAYLMLFAGVKKFENALEIK